MRKLTVKFIEDDGRDWFEINGNHDGTGIDFDSETFGLTYDGQFLDFAGNPMNPTDLQTIAVKFAINQFLDNLIDQNGTTNLQLRLCAALRGD